VQVAMTAGENMSSWTVAIARRARPSSPMEELWTRSTHSATEGRGPADFLCKGGSKSRVSAWTHRNLGDRSGERLPLRRRHRLGTDVHRCL